MSGFCPTPYKDAFDSMGQARKVVGQMTRRGRTGKNKPLAAEPYRCPCGSYHVADPRRSQHYEHQRRRAAGKW